VPIVLSINNCLNSTNSYIKKKEEEPEPTPAEPEVIPPKEATPPPPPIPPVEDKGASDIESDQVIFSVLYYAFI
jgi:hypothetical protein